MEIGGDALALGFARALRLAERMTTLWRRVLRKAAVEIALFESDSATPTAPAARPTQTSGISPRGAKQKR